MWNGGGEIELIHTNSKTFVSFCVRGGANNPHYSLVVAYSKRPSRLVSCYLRNFRPSSYPVGENLMNSYYLKA